MPSNWKSYFCNVNGELASIALDLSLRDAIPMPDRPWLLWVWVYLKSPRPDGLSDTSEFPTICQIEDELTRQIGDLCSGIYAGRITTQGRRELYFYGASRDKFKKAVKSAMSGFPAYKYDFNSQHEPDWNQYLNVLWPSEESLQRMGNMDVLGVLAQHGDNPALPRDVTHWIYFATPADRDRFTSIARDLGYAIREYEREHGDRPHALAITRNQSIRPAEIDAAVLELFRLAKQHNAEYDGWEAQPTSAPNS